MVTFFYNRNNQIKINLLTIKTYSSQIYRVVELAHLHFHDRGHRNRLAAAQEVGEGQDLLVVRQRRHRYVLNYLVQAVHCEFCQCKIWVDEAFVGRRLDVQSLRKDDLDLAWSGDQAGNGEEDAKSCSLSTKYSRAMLDIEGRNQLWLQGLDEYVGRFVLDEAPI